MRSMNRRWAAMVVATVVAVGLTTGACGGDKKKEKHATTFQAGTTTVPASIAELCTLVTTADVEAQLGGDFGDGQASNEGRCQWTAGTGDVTFAIALSPDDLAATKTRFVDNGAQVEDVGGVGDGAFWIATGNVAQLTFGAKGRAFAMTYNAPTSPPANIKDRLTALARTAIGHL
jgi:hypothetical protein